MSTVLIADDDPNVREFLAAYLTEEGFTVLEAANGLEALLRIKRERPDTILLDLKMPRLGGPEVLRHLRRLDPAIRVFIVTGFPEDAAQLGESPNVADIFTKPVQMDALVQALRSQTAPRQTAEAPSAPPQVAGSENVARRPAKVLIVDDDPGTGSVLRDLVTALGYEAQWVSDSAGALRDVVQTPPDVVLLDILMPGLSGLDVLPSLRALVPGAPVIMVSGAADAELARQALARGAFDYVVKPVDIRHLGEVLDLALIMKNSRGAQT